MYCMDCKRYGVKVETIRVGTRETAEVCVDTADCKASRKPRHTVRGETSETGWDYGVTHDYDCPGCAGTSFTASPRSETYWAS